MAILRPRGIVKWQPFASVNDPIGDSFELDRINNIQPMMDLSEQQLESMQYELEQAIEAKREVVIHYYSDFEFKVVKGSISKVDSLNFIVEIDSMEIEINTISMIALC